MVSSRLDDVAPFRSPVLVKGRKIYTTAKMATLFTEVRRQGKVIEEWAAGDGNLA